MRSSSPACSNAPGYLCQTDAAAQLFDHLARLVAEKEQLGRELQRCHAQLDLVFEITAEISHLHDPDAIEAALLRRHAAMLGAAAMFLDRAGCCRRVELHQAGRPELEADVEVVRAVLASAVELVRGTRRALVPALTAEDLAALQGAHVLLAALPRADCETGVTITLRAASQPPFDARDTLASESVLSYGAQVLSNALMVRHLRRTALETVCTLVNAIDAKDNYTAAHSERVGAYARMTGEAHGLPKTQLQALEWAGLLHDVGKIGIPEHVLNKPGPFTAAELRQMRKHPQIGYDVLKPIEQVVSVLDVVLLHHENYDGSGYPQGLAADAVPLEARIVHVVDIFDALTTTRPYRQGYRVDEAIRLLQAGAGTATDPEVTHLFIQTLQQHLMSDPDAFYARFGHHLDTAGPLVG